MRYIFCLGLGLMIGAMLALIASNILHRTTVYHRGLMAVMQHELGRAREATRLEPCNSIPIIAALSRLRLLAVDIEPAFFPSPNKDNIFQRYVQDLQDTLAAVDLSQSCHSQLDAFTKVANTCEACHRDYR